MFISHHLSKFVMGSFLALLILVTII